MTGCLTSLRTFQGSLMEGHVHHNDVTCYVDDSHYPWWLEEVKRSLDTNLSVVL